MESKFNYREPIFSKEAFVDAINVLLLASFITSLCIIVGLFCVFVNLVVSGVVIDSFTMLLSGIFLLSIFFSIYLIDKKIVNIVWW